MAKKTLDDPHNVFHYLLTTHAPLIQKNIKSLRKKGHLPEKDDMGRKVEDWEFHEAGMRGLMEAAAKYKPEFGPFSTYASASIRGRIQSHADSMNQIPRHLRMQAKRFTEMQQGVPEATPTPGPAVAEVPAASPPPAPVKPKV